VQKNRRSAAPTKQITHQRAHFRNFLLLLPVEEAADNSTTELYIFQSAPEIPKPNIFY
jgi:hypothetical protein